ncbi:MAG: hypothetical protein RL011_560 [Pseudomonadota bacterium]|jgi:alkylation response protein AidB-like acyl-CoA dehydrogenase
MQMKTNFVTDTPDIKYHLTRRINFQELFAGLTAEEREVSGCSTADEYRDLVLTSLETLGELCGTEIAPRAAQVEKEPIFLKDGDVVLPPTVVDNVQKLLQLGAASLSAAPKYGGMGLPFLVEACANEVIMRACPSTGLNIVWFGGISAIVEKFGSDEIKDYVMQRITSGEWSGSMALTEPDAGSDLGSLRTYGEEQPDGTWRLYGSKRFISNGNSQVCLVLAMNAKGVKGLNNLNMFLCLRKPPFRLDGKVDPNVTYNYTVNKIEDKLGLHGSATCELNFDGSVAYLLGENGKGFQHMLHLMNDARIAVGFQALGNMEAIFRLSKDYCDQRKAWGVPIAHHEMVAEKLLDMEVDTRALRSLCYQAAYNQSVMYQCEKLLEDKSLSDERRHEIERKAGVARKRVRKMTPLIKWYGAERAIKMSHDCLALHGGYGYTREYRAEWWVRETPILAIYEGTSHIQALMCVKDTLKDVIRNPTKFIETSLGLRVQALRPGDSLRKKLYRAKQIESGAIMSLLLRLLKTNVRETISEVKPTDLLRMVKILSRDLIKMENVGPALLHAERICEIKSLVTLAQCLVWDAEDDPSRAIYAERFLNKSWPRLNQLKLEIETDDSVLQSRLDAYRAEAPEGATRVAG